MTCISVLFALFLFGFQSKGYGYLVVPDHGASFSQNSSSSWKRYESQNHVLWAHKEGGWYCGYQVKGTNSCNSVASLKKEPNNVLNRSVQKGEKNKVAGRPRRCARTEKRLVNKSNPKAGSRCEVPIKEIPQVTPFNVHDLNPCVADYCHGSLAMRDKKVSVLHQAFSIVRLLHDVAPFLPEASGAAFLGAGLGTVALAWMPAHVIVAGVAATILGVIKRYLEAVVLCMDAEAPVVITPSDSELPDFPSGRPHVEIKDGIKYVEGNPAIVNPDKTARHFAENVQQGKSILYGTLEDAQQLLDEYAGTGISHFNPSSKKEIINTCDRVIGIYFKDGQCIGETTRFTIHYSNTGAHIIPSKPTSFLGG